MSIYIGQYGRKFNDFQEFKDYIKSCTPHQVESEFTWLSKQQITPEVNAMFNLCQSALVHIQNHWADTF
jgi:hypothetical protein